MRTHDPQEPTELEDWKTADQRRPAAVVDGAYDVHNTTRANQKTTGLY